ncbi:MAG: cation:proton antiporter [Duodenibacillus sp.]|nr:cation:proton antiporter [Duodenibacillus sp.]
MHASLPLITTFSLAFGLALVFGYMAEKLKSPPLVGYLVAGIVVGPYTKFVQADMWLASQLAEIGVMLLMFGVGLHFSIRDLMRVKAIAVPGALMQMVSAVAIWGCFAFFVWGWSVASSLIFGLCLSCASTVVLLKALELRGKLTSLEGQIAVGWLIFQDIATVLILVLLPPIAEILGVNAGASLSGEDIAWTIGKTLLRVMTFIVLMLIVGRRLIPILLQWIVDTKSQELFTVAILACAICIAFVAAAVFEVSFALGAFFAGVIVQETRFARRATKDSLSMRDAFSVLFFVSVGMMLDWHVLLEQPFNVLCVLGIVMIGNAMIAAFAVLVLRYPLRTSITIGACLSQIGEFSYILVGQGIALRMVDADVLSMIVAASIFSIALNPLMYAVVEPVYRFLLERSTWARSSASRHASEQKSDSVEKVLPSQILIVGDDNAAMELAGTLSHAGMPVTFLTENPELSERLGGQAICVIEGRTSERSCIEQADIDRTSLAVLSGVPFEKGREIITALRDMNPGVRIAVRTARAPEKALYAELLPDDLVLYGEDILHGQEASGGAAANVA